jgi:hypothetical protein
MRAQSPFDAVKIAFMRAPSSFEADKLALMRTLSSFDADQLAFMRTLSSFELDKLTFMRRLLSFEADSGDLGPSLGLSRRDQPSALPDCSTFGGDDRGAARPGRRDALPLPPHGWRAMPSPGRLYGGMTVATLSRYAA